MASLILTIGIVALFSNFTSAQKLGNSAEAHQAAASVAEGELERLRNLKWARIGMAVVPERSSESTNPTYYEVTPASTKCKNMSGGEAELENCYEWDWSETSKREPMVVEPEAAEGITTNPKTVTVASVVKGTTTRLTFKVYRFITWVTDKACETTGCPGVSDAKRVVVAVTGSNLKKPVAVMSILNDTELSGKNPLKSVKCEEGGVEVACIAQK